MRNMRSPPCTWGISTVRRYQHERKKPLGGDSAQQRFRREGNDDRSIPGDLTGERPVAIRVEGEIPASVERLPACSLQLRSRMGFRYTGHACSSTAIAERPDRPGARHDAGVIVSTGELSTSGDFRISAYVRTSIAGCQCRRLSSGIRSGGHPGYRDRLRVSFRGTAVARGASSSVAVAHRHEIPHLWVRNEPFQ